MQASISTNSVANELTLLSVSQLGGNPKAPFYEGECQVRACCTARAGIDGALVQRKDVSVPIWSGGTNLSRKEASPGHYQPSYGEVVVSRHLIRQCGRDDEYAPRDQLPVEFRVATPLLAEVISFKLASAPAGEVGKTWPRVTAGAVGHVPAPPGAKVGQIALAACSLALQSPAILPPAPYRDWPGWDQCRWSARIQGAMCGTLALYDAEGNGCSTEYLGTMRRRAGHFP